MHTCFLRKLLPLRSKAYTIQMTTSTYPLFKDQVMEAPIPTSCMSFLLPSLKENPPTLMAPSRPTLLVLESWRTNLLWKEEKLNTYRSSHLVRIKRPEKFSGLFFILFQDSSLKKHPSCLLNAISRIKFNYDLISKIQKEFVWYLYLSKFYHLDEKTEGTSKV